MLKPAGMIGPCVSASLIPNALTSCSKVHCVDSKQFRHAASLTQTLREQHLAYATTTNVVVSDAANLKGTSANCQVLQCQATVMQVRLCRAGGADVLVVGTSDGVQVWDPVRGTRITAYPIPYANAGTPPADRRNYVRGITLVPRGSELPALVVGTSSGGLHVFEVDGQRFLYLQAFSGHHRAPIADIASTHEPAFAAHTLAPAPLFAVADEGGELSVWDAGALVPVAEMRAAGEAFLCVQCRGDAVYAGTITGKILVFCISTQRLQCEIAAHARSVLALQLHPMQEQLISASEDTYINVWNLEGRQGRLAHEIEANLSVSLKDQLICGANFVGTGGKDVAIVSYDVEAICLIEGEIMMG